MRRIFALGPAGTNGHEAAKKISQRLFPGEPCEICFCSRNIEVLERASRERTYGVVPIENSTAGIVSEVVKGFWLKQDEPHSLWVIGELELPAEHHLLVRRNINMPEELSSVLSHPQALVQCAGTLESLGIKTAVPTSSTAAAAEAVSTDDTWKNTGAVASRFAAEVYGLKVIHENLEDVAGNTTRFHVVGSHPVLPTGNDRTAVIFRLPNAPGSLVAALSVISRWGINMTSIHSIPLGPGEYGFYCEFEDHFGGLWRDKILAALRSATTKLIILGSFPKES